MCRAEERRAGRAGRGGTGRALLVGGEGAELAHGGSKGRLGRAGPGELRVINRARDTPQGMRFCALDSALGSAHPRPTPAQTWGAHGRMTAHEGLHLKGAGDRLNQVYDHNTKGMHAKNKTKKYLLAALINF